MPKQKTNSTQNYHVVRTTQAGVEAVRENGQRVVVTAFTAKSAKLQAKRRYGSEVVVQPV